MVNQLHEAVAESIVRENKDELMLLSPAERKTEVNKILSHIATKDNDDLISYISKKGSDVSPEINQRIEMLEAAEQAKGGSILMGTKATPGEIEAYKKSAQHVKELQEIGVVTGRELPAGSIEIGFSDDPAKAMKNALSEYFGVETPVFRRGRDILYLNPETKEVVRAEPNLLQGLGFGVTMTGDIVGTTGGAVVAGAVTKHPAGVVAGETVGSTVGTASAEYTRLVIGKMMGAHDLSNEDMLKQAGITGLKAGAATGAVGMTMASAKGVYNFMKGGIMTKAEALKHGLSSQEAEAVLAEVNKILSKAGAKEQIKGTLGKMSNEAFVSSKEAHIRKSVEHAQRFIERDLADEKALMRAMDTVTQPSTAKGGRAVADVLEKQVRKRITQAKDIVVKNVTEFKKQLDNIGKVKKELVGQPTRDVIVAKSEAADAAQQGLWTGLKKAHGFNDKKQIFDIKVPIGENIKNTSNIMSRRADTASTLITKRGSSKIFTKAKKPKPADLSDFNREISDLRSEIRAAYKGRQFGTPQTRDMQEALDAMVMDRKLALTKAGKVKLLDDIEKAEKATADFHKVYNRSVIGDLTKKNDRGIFEIESKEFVDKVLKGTGDDAQQLLNVIGDHPTLIAKWKDGIADAYKRAAFKNGKFNRDASTNFIQKNEDVLGKFFSKGDLSALQKTGNLAEKVAKQNDQLKRIIRNADSNFGKGKLKSLDPDNLVKFVTEGSGSFSTPTGRGVQIAVNKIKAVKNYTKNYPAAWKAFQEEYSTQLRQRAIDAKTKNLSTSAMNKLVKDNKNEITEVMGKEYYNDLVKINNALSVVRKPIKELTENEIRHGVLAIVRAVVAPPLTRRGRALTAADVFENKAAKAVIADSLLNPSIMKQVAKASEHKRLTREAAELYVSLGLIKEDE